MMRKFFISLSLLMLSMLSSIAANEENVPTNIRVLGSPRDFGGKQVQIGGICRIRLGQSFIAESTEQLESGLPASVVSLQVPAELFQKLSKDKGIDTTIRGPFIVSGIFALNPVKGSEQVGEIKVQKIEEPMAGKRQAREALLSEAKDFLEKHPPGGDAEKDRLISLIEALMRELGDSKDSQYR